MSAEDGGGRRTEDGGRKVHSHKGVFHSLIMLQILSSRLTIEVKYWYLLISGTEMEVFFVSFMYLYGFTKIFRNITAAEVPIL
jgi:hypothetical protein